MSLSSRAALPSLEGATEWIGGEPALVPGCPVFVHFWSVSCPLCHENMHEVEEWKSKYGSSGLQFVAVHLPFHESDNDVQLVRETTRKLELVESVAVDNGRVLSQKFGCEYAPAYFLFDREWKLSCRAAGLYGLKLVETSLEKLFQKS